MIDEQHKKLIEETNALYQGCLSGSVEERKAYFMQAVKSVVDYIKYHFSAEENMLEKVKYPAINAQKKEHACFVEKRLTDVKSYQEGQKLVPNAFVRFLRDWILSHIAVEDTKYARYILDLKKSGNLERK